MYNHIKVIEVFEVIKIQEKGVICLQDRRALNFTFLMVLLIFGAGAFYCFSVGNVVGGVINALGFLAFVVMLASGYRH